MCNRKYVFHKDVSRENNLITFPKNKVGILKKYVLSIFQFLVIFESKDSQVMS